jgi:hypothetical protein
MPNINPTAFFIAFGKLTEELSTVSPNFMSFAMLESIPPATSINCSISLSQEAIATLNVVCPATFINIAVRVIELPLTACLIE